MNTEIFIVTHAKDFVWLKYCLCSMHKFCAGFDALRILVPTQDLNLLQSVVDENSPGFKTVCIGADEWEGRGMVWHMNQIMHADEWCPDADFIAHVDPDCIFTAPVTPKTYISEGRPILRYERFSEIGKRHDGVMRWRECTQHCLPFPVEYETMRCHPEVYHRGLYAETRRIMHMRTGKTVPDYIKECRNEFPQTFCEFVTLGNVAMFLFRDKYAPVEQRSDVVTPPNHLQQFWSHGAIDQPQDIWVLGKQKRIVPLEMIKEIGLA